MVWLIERWQCIILYQWLNFHSSTVCVICFYCDDQFCSFFLNSYMSIFCRPLLNVFSFQNNPVYIMFSVFGAVTIQKRQFAVIVRSSADNLLVVLRPVHTGDYSRRKRRFLFETATSLTFSATNWRQCGQAFMARHAATKFPKICRRVLELVYVSNNSSAPVSSRKICAYH